MNATDILFFMFLFSGVIASLGYFTWQLNAKFKDIKSKLIKNQVLIKSINKQLESMQTSMIEHKEALENIQKISVRKQSIQPSKDIIHGYERAKDLVQKGLSLDKSSLKSCNLTEEELELLSDMAE
jgi:hypothetical protein